MFFYEASGGNATFNLTDGASVQFGGLAGSGGADHATVNCTDAYGVLFLENASAGEGHFTITTSTLQRSVLDTRATLPTLRARVMALL